MHLVIEELVCVVGGAPSDVVFGVLAGADFEEEGDHFAVAHLGGDVEGSVA